MASASVSPLIFGISVPSSKVTPYSLLILVSGNFVQHGYISGLIDGSAVVPTVVSAVVVSRVVVSGVVIPAVVVSAVVETTDGDVVSDVGLKFKQWSLFSNWHSFL